MKYLRKLAIVALLALAASGSALALTPSTFQVLFSGGWWLPGASVDMNFAQAKYYGCDISCISVSRASTGYAQTSSGLLVPFASNVARITNQGFLIEEARTNLILWSTDLTNGVWTHGGATITAGFATAPDGTNTGVRVQIAAGAQNTNNVAQVVSGAAANQTHTETWYVRATSGTQKFALKLTQQAVADHFSTDLTVTTSWQRVQFSQAFAAGGTGSAIIALLNDAAGDAADLIVWGPQLEANTSFPTSYIPTTTASATRAADVPQLIGAAATAALAGNGSIYAQTNLGEGITTNARLLTWAGGASALIGSTTTAQLSDGTHNATATVGSGSYAGVLKSAFGFDSASFTAIANGGTKATSLNAWTGNTGTVTLGNFSGGTRALNGYMQRFALSATKGAFDGLTAP